MARREYNPLDVFLLLDSDMRRTAVNAQRALQFQPAIDMYETASALVVEMELAGIVPERLRITLSADDRVLSVAGERREPQADHQERTRCYHLEIFFGQFERQIVLPSNVAFDRENITANYRDGFLIIALPKRAEPRHEKRVIEVQK